MRNLCLRCGRAGRGRPLREGVQRLPVVFHSARNYERPHCPPGPLSLTGPSSRPPENYLTAELRSKNPSCTSRRSAVSRATRRKIPAGTGPPPSTAYRSRRT
jgi:hypothetical protein